MDWIEMVQDRDQWRALVNTVMKLRVTYNVGKFLSSCILAASQEGIGFMKLENEGQNSSCILIFALLCTSI
jgi:hypothetical protein